jgi:hypothetical protein
MLTRFWAVVGVGLVLAQLPAAAAGAAAVRITSASAKVSWRQGWLQPGASVVFTGRIGAAATLTAALRPLDRPGTVTARTEFVMAHGGTFTRRLRLPPRPLPGTYSLRVGGTTGEGVRRAEVRIRIPAPPEGVLARAEVGTTPHGPWLLYKRGSPPVISGSHRIWVRFHFLSPPTGKRIELVWKLHWRTVVRRVATDYKDTLVTSVGSSTGLPTGHWSTELTVDGRVAKKMDVIVR